MFDLFSTIYGEYKSPQSTVRIRHEICQTSSRCKAGNTGHGTRQLQTMATLGVLAPDVGATGCKHSATPATTRPQGVSMPSVFPFEATNPMKHFDTVNDHTSHVLKFRPAAEVSSILFDLQTTTALRVPATQATP